MKQTSGHLRVGVLVNSDKIPNWQVYVLEKLLADETIELLIFESKEKSIDAWENNTWFKVQQKIEQYLFKVPRNFFAQNALWKERLPKNGESVNTIPLVSKKEDQILQIQNQKPEIFFNLCEGKDLALSALTFGSWSFQSENNLDWFYAFKKGKGVTEIRIFESDLKKSFNYSFTTDSISLLKNKNTFAWKSASAMLGLINKIKLNKNESLDSFLVETKSETRKDKIKKLGFFDFISISGKQLSTGFSKVFSKLFFVNQWYLLFKFGNENIEDQSTYQKIKPSRDKFWADPYVIFRDEKAYVFFEELPFKKNIGHISFIEIDSDGHCSEEQVVLKKDYHLSYPFMFEEDGETYMIPESNQNRTIELYRCKAFPEKWEFVMNLMEDVRIVDSTLLFHNNKWWLFGGMAKEPWDSPNEELHLFYADSLLTTDWTPHPKNPISTDTRNARSAGPIFTKNDKIYRPAQNCSFVYGYGIQINEILILTETEYREKLVSSILPTEKRTHTLACYPEITVLDALSKEISLAN